MNTTASNPQQPQPAMQSPFDGLPLDMVCRAYHNYLDTFQPDLPLALAFINRALSEPGGALPPAARSLLTQAIKAAVQLDHFNPFVLGIGINAGICPRAEAVVKVLEATHVEPETFDLVRKAPFKFHSVEMRRICEDMLARHPMALRYADWLLQVDLYEGRPPCPALSGFHCPKMLRPLWQKRLFNHQAALGNDAGAWPLWEMIRDQVDDPFTLSRAAELHLRAGDTATAIACYERAAALDPLVRPYALRLAELRRPFEPDPSLVSRRKVAIYLYSYNKAAVLGETLESLSRCDIGPARITVLLNGCTDDSLEVVTRAKTLFPRNDFEIVTLPVNVGAPAARNWLLSLPGTRECDYVAFLDDDLFLQPDWLAHLLTVAERDPRIGNVGCKVVFPGEFPLLQYLYRHVNLATPEVIRVSLPTPAMQYDIGLYDVIREVRVVMGCQHLLRVASLPDAPTFDIRYSPSQIDDTDHDLQLCLAGWKVFYCGTVTCVHRQNSGTSTRSRLSMASHGSIMGNDVKFHYKWLEHLDAVAKLDSLRLG